MCTLVSMVWGGHRIMKSTAKVLYCSWLIAACLLVQGMALDAIAQAVDRNAQRDALNSSSVMISADHPDSTMMKLADDLSAVLRDGEDSVKVVPVVGDGARGNLRDLLLLRNIDLSLTDLVALKKVRESKEWSQAPWLEIAHVATLFPDTIQIFARKDIGNIKQLDGAKISIGLEGSGSELHGKQVLDALQLDYTPLHLTVPDSAQALVKGEIDAMICFCLSSPGLYKHLAFNLDIHILPVPFNPSLHADYLPATIEHEEFPYFIRKGERIETVAVTLALVTYNWKKDNERYARVEKFVESFFNNMSRLQSEPRHHGWKQVDLSAQAPGWPRFPAAQEWLDERRGQALQEMRVAFNEFLDRWSEPVAQEVKQNDQTELFEEFLRWRASAQ